VPSRYDCACRRLWYTHKSGALRLDGAMELAQQHSTHKCIQRQDGQIASTSAARRLLRAPVARCQACQHPSRPVVTQPLSLPATATRWRPCWVHAGPGTPGPTRASRDGPLGYLLARLAAARPCKHLAAVQCHCSDDFVCPTRDGALQALSQTTGQSRRASARWKDGDERWRGGSVLQPSNRRWHADSPCIAVRRPRRRVLATFGQA
jgi:hypothetical protein